MKKGFTVIEVLVVIGIIAVLTVIVFPAINNIRAKNRDAERVADISAIQLGLSLYKSQNQNGEYPKTLDQNDFSKYITLDSLTPPNTEPDYNYEYVPLARASNPDKCIYYHLGTRLELPNAQIDTTDKFVSTDSTTTNGYVYCMYNGTGINGEDEQIYDVHP